MQVQVAEVRIRVGAYVRSSTYILPGTYTIASVFANIEGKPTAELVGVYNILNIGYSVILMTCQARFCPG
jgi:hypothetical protein